MTTDWTHDPRVALVREVPRYGSAPPYPPSEPYPELPMAPPGREENPGYRAVRAALLLLGLDREHAGTPAWNPLAAWVRPGGTIALKPNFVAHRNHRSGSTRADLDCVVTHGSVVRAVLDYAAKALGGDGRIVVGDCPIQGTRWPDLVRAVGLDEVLADARRRFPGVEFRAEDFRLTRAHVVAGHVVSRQSAEVDPARYREVDLRADSLLVPLMAGQYEFGVIQYPRHRMRAAHGPTTNRYVMPRDLLEADLFVNLPKMKSHQKAGVTCALKNLVGINGHKDYLPHFRFGSPKSGGDEYPDGGAGWDLYWSIVHRNWDRDRGSLKTLLGVAAVAWFEVLHHAFGASRELFAQGGGSWWGNDTLWRTVLDINRAFLYYDRESGEVGATPRKGYLALLDGLVGGDRESPLEPSPVASGVVLAARNPVALDTVAAELMRLDYLKVPQLAHAYDAFARPLAAFRPEDIEVLGPHGLRTLDDVRRDGSFASFAPSHGWKGHVERDPLPPAPEIARAG